MTTSIEDMERRLSGVSRMPDLDAMRMEVVTLMKSDGTEETFRRIQTAFIKAKNRLKRVPLSKRDW